MFPHDGEDLCLFLGVRIVYRVVQSAAFLAFHHHLLDVLYTKFLGSPLDEQEEKLIKEIDDAVLWYDMKYLLGEDSEGDKPETCMVPDYTVRAFKNVEQEYLEIFEKYKVL